MPSDVHGVHYGLHGRVSHLPAECVTYGGVVYDDDGEAHVEILGEVVEAGLGSPSLVLRRRLLVNTCRPELHIEDSVMNEGYTVAGHMFRHHFNLGYPAVQQGTVVETSAVPFAVRDPGEIPTLPWQLMDESTAAGTKLAEKVVYCRPTTDLVTTRILAPDTRWIEIETTRQQWPYLLLWRDPRPGMNVMGVEPSTSRDGGRAEAEASGEVVWLEPGQTVNYRSTVRVGRSPLAPSKAVQDDN